MNREEIDKAFDLAFKKHKMMVDNFNDALYQADLKEFKETFFSLLAKEPASLTHTEKQ